MKTKLPLIALSTLLICLTACHSRTTPNHVRRLLEHPQFEQAKKAAPDWTKDALGTVNDLQRDLEKEKASK